MPVGEMRANQRYEPRQAAIALTSPDFERVRCTQFGHTILTGALVSGDQVALSFKKTLLPRTQIRIDREVDELQETRYRGRPLAFLTERKRREIGSKISQGLRRYHQQKQLRVV